MKSIYEVFNKNNYGIFKTRSNDFNKVNDGGFKKGELYVFTGRSDYKHLFSVTSLLDYDLNIGSETFMFTNHYNTGQMINLSEDYTDLSNVSVDIDIPFGSKTYDSLREDESDIINDGSLHDILEVADKTALLIVDDMFQTYESIDNNIADLEKIAKEHYLAIIYIIDITGKVDVIPDKKELGYNIMHFEEDEESVIIKSAKGKVVIKKEDSIF